MQKSQLTNINDAQKASLNLQTWIMHKRQVSTYKHEWYAKVKSQYTNINDAQKASLNLQTWMSAKDKSQLTNINDTQRASLNLQK